MSKTIQPKILKQFTIARQLGSGAYGYVWEVKCKKTQKKFALKKIFDAFRNQVDAQRTYRQIQFLQKEANPIIIKMNRIISSKNKKDVYVLFEYMEADLQIAPQYSPEKSSDFYFLSDFIRNLMHRDMKPSNILIDNDSKIKICDFGLLRSCHNDSDGELVLTDEIATKWYRAPQVLLGSKKYSNKIDIWSFGCIVAELLTKKIAFPGNTTLDQFQLMIQFNGPLSVQDQQSLMLQNTQKLQQLSKFISQRPFQSYLPQVDKQFYPLIKNSLQVNPNNRLSAKQLLKLPIFNSFRNKRQLQVKDLQMKQFLFQLNDNRMYNVEEYREKILEIQTRFNSASENQTSLQKNIQFSSKLQSQIEKQKIKSVKRERKQIKRNSKSLNHNSINETKLKEQKRNFSTEILVKSKKILMPKVRGLDKSLESLQRQKKSLQPLKECSFSTFKQKTLNTSIPYLLKPQKMIKKPNTIKKFPILGIQNKRTHLQKKSFHNCFSNQSKLFLKEQNSEKNLHCQSIYRNSILNQPEQKRQLYIYSNWITETIYGKQSRIKKV